MSSQCEREEGSATPPALAPGQIPAQPPSQAPKPSSPQPPPQADPLPDLHSIRKDLTYLSHHVYRMVLALQVPPCTCATCSEKHVSQSNLILNLAQANNGAPAPTRAHPAVEALSNGHASAPDESEPGSACHTPDANGPLGPLVISEKDYDTDMSSEDQHMPLQAPDTNSIPPPMEGTPSALAGLSQAAALFGASPQGLMDLSPEKLTALLSATQTGSFVARGGGAPRRGRGSGAVGRRSKYCTAEEKAAVAAYATLHGASAAARKFNIPPAVAAYYHRKIYNRALPKGRRPMFSMEAQAGQAQQMPLSGSLGTQLPLRPERDSTPTMVPMAGQEEVQHEGSSSPRMSANSGLGARVGSGKRGRPKLIGDDVDADLLEYLVKLRREQPGLQLNADTVLAIATAFIRQRCPGLLVEDGGTVQLRPTWAMKMLMRMNEWDRLMPAAREGNGSANNGEEMLMEAPTTMPPQIRTTLDEINNALRSPGHTATVIPTSPANSPPMQHCLPSSLLFPNRQGLKTEAKEEVREAAPTLTAYEEEAPPPPPAPFSPTNSAALAMPPPGIVT